MRVETLTPFIFVDYYVARVSRFVTFYYTYLINLYLSKR
jgi:hypothetical protein